jgi:hypothetical protein
MTNVITVCFVVMQYTVERKNIEFYKDVKESLQDQIDRLWKEIHN